MEGGRYRLRKAPKRDLYWVVGEDGHHMSKDPIPKERAKKQMAALYIAMRKEGKNLKGGLIYPEEQLIMNDAPKYAKAVLADTTSPDRLKELQSLTVSKKQYEADAKRHKKLTGMDLMSYDEYKRVKEKADLGRAITGFSPEAQAELDRRTAEESDFKTQREALLAEHPEYAPEEEVVSPFDENGKPNGQRNVVPLSEAQRRREVANYENLSPTNKGFRKLNNALLSVGDVVADALPGGVGKIMSGLYSMVRPQEKYAGSGMDFLGKSPQKTLMDGEGIFSDLYSKAKSVVQRGVDVVRGVRRDLPPPAREYLKKVGNLIIHGMFVRRDPVQAVLKGAINAISLGTFTPALEAQNYDKIFHLSLEATVAPHGGGAGFRVIIEKNAVISIRDAKARRPNEDSQSMVVQIGGMLANTINGMLDLSKRKMGDNFYLYDGLKNNCQDFIYQLLLNNNLMTPELGKFIKQPMEQVVKQLPSYTGTVMNAITNLGAVADVALHGQARVKPVAKKRQARLAPVVIKSPLEVAIDALASTLGRSLTLGEKEGLAKQLEGRKAPPNSPAESEGEGRGGKAPHPKFASQLKSVGAEAYLKEAQRKAKHWGYRNVGFSSDEHHKLQIPNADGKLIRFGSVGLGDHILYSLSGDKTADKHKKSYLARATKIKGDWKSNPYSPNNLAIRILW